MKSPELQPTRLILARPGTAWFRWLQRMNAREAALAMHDGLNATWLIFFYCVAVLLEFSRSPSLFIHAVFYAEDGAVWYADAYNLGWLRSLSIPDGGYLNTIQRLGAGPALLVPFAHAPLVMMLVGLLVQCLPVPILLSARCRRWAPLPTRALFAAIYVVLPASREVHVVLTNSQWRLGIAAALLAFAAPPQNWRACLVDALVLLVSGFSGPFGIVMLPFVAIFWWTRRQSSTLAAMVFLGIGSVVQAWLIVQHHGDRVQGYLGATVKLFLKMLGGEIMLGGIFGGRHFPTDLPFPVLLAAVVLGTIVYLYALRFASLELRLFTLFCLLLLPPELKSPLIAGPKPLWDLLTEATSGRYWFFPMLAFVWCAAWCALHARSKQVRWLATAMMIGMPVGIVSDWPYGQYQDVGFKNGVQRLQAAKPGEHVVIQVLPPLANPILMKLTKK